MEETIQILSLEDFIHHVSWLSKHSPDLWFRGVSDASYSLTPGLYREPFNSLLRDPPAPDDPTTLSEGGRKNIYWG